MRRESISARQVTLWPYQRIETTNPCVSELMAQEMRAAYAERMREIAARAETLPREIQELDARITRLHERLKAGDPDLAADELQAGIERPENKMVGMTGFAPATPTSRRARINLLRILSQNACGSHRLRSGSAFSSNSSGSFARNFRNACAGERPSIVW